MNIAFISYHTSPLANQEGKETGGMNVYVLELAKALSELGHSIDIYTRSENKNDDIIKNVNDRVRVVCLKAGEQKPINKKNLEKYLDEFSENMLEFIKTENVHYDTIHAHYYYSGLIALQLKKKLKDISLIMTFHTLALMKNLVARTLSEHAEEFRIKAEFELIKKSDRIIALSGSEKCYLHYLYNADLKKIRIIQPGVNRNVFRKLDQQEAKAKIGAEKDHKIVLFVGRIEPLKGIDTLIYAIKIITEKNPKIPVCLWIVGGDVSQPESEWSEELKKLEKTRQLLNIHTSVSFVGQQPQEMLPYYYNAADVVVMPSHYESFGIVALEAMACGTPVITTNVTGVSSLIDLEEEVLITSVNNPLVLANQIEYILAHDNFRVNVSEQIEKNANELSWENIAEEVVAEYKRAYST